MAKKPQKDDESYEIGPADAGAHHPVDSKRPSSPDQARAGHVEGPDGDAGRLAEQKDLARRQAEEAAPLETARLARNAAIDALEAEIKRHEESFEALTAGALRAEPYFPVPALHDMRVRALRYLASMDTPTGILQAAADEMKAVTFRAVREVP